MSCIYKIREAENSLTNTEKLIAEYILDHRQEVIDKSAQQLGELTSTSSAAWIRFAKKLGYKGLPALKVDLAKSIEEEDDLVSVIIEEKDSLDVLVKKVQAMSYQNIEGTYKLLNLNLLRQAIEWINEARRIYLVGVGGSGIACTDFMHKMTRLDKEVIYHEDEHILAARVAHIQPEDVLIAISYSGKTPSVNTIVKYAKEMKAKVIAITQYNITSPLSTLADIALYVPLVEKKLRLGSIASRNAELILTDMLFYGFTKYHFDETKENLIKTRQLIQEINEN